MMGYLQGQRGCTWLTVVIVGYLQLVKSMAMPSQRDTSTTVSSNAPTYDILRCNRDSECRNVLDTSSTLSIPSLGKRTVETGAQSLSHAVRREITNPVDLNNTNEALDAAWATLTPSTPALDTLKNKIAEAYNNPSFRFGRESVFRQALPRHFKNVCVPLLVEETGEPRSPLTELESLENDRCKTIFGPAMMLWTREFCKPDIVDPYVDLRPHEFSLTMEQKIDRIYCEVLGDYLGVKMSKRSMDVHEERTEDDLQRDDFSPMGAHLTDTDDLYHDLEVAYHQKLSEEGKQKFWTSVCLPLEQNAAVHNSESTTYMKPSTWGHPVDALRSFCSSIADDFTPVTETSSHEDSQQKHEKRSDGKEFTIATVATPTGVKHAKLAIITVPIDSRVPQKPYNRLYLLPSNRTKATNTISGKNEICGFDDLQGPIIHTASNDTPRTSSSSRTTLPNSFLMITCLIIFGCMALGTSVTNSIPEYESSQITLTVKDSKTVNSINKRSGGNAAIVAAGAESFVTSRARTSAALPGQVANLYLVLPAALVACVAASIRVPRLPYRESRIRRLSKKMTIKVTRK